MPRRTDDDNNPAAQPLADLPLADLPTVACGAGFEMLQGVRILDLTTSIAGPYASMLLGDMGAEIIKVERLQGDDARTWGPPFLNEESLWFLSVNRNKRSVALDYTTAQGLEAVHALAEKCDAMIVNMPARVSKKLGLDQATIRANNPSLVYVSISGFGMEGERADWPCYDLIAEGYSGVMDLTGEAGGEPQKIGAPAADMLAGQDAAYATIAALYRRAHSSKGATIDIALVDSMTRFLTCRIVPYLGSGENPRRSGGKDSVIAIYQTFDTADEPITIGLGNRSIWCRFWNALGRPEMENNPRYSTNALCQAHRPEIVAAIQKILLTASRSHWLSLFQSARVPAGPINQVADAVADHEMRRRGLIYTLKCDDRLIPQVGPAVRIDKQTGYARLPPPRLGEHTEEILRDLLSYDETQIAELQKRGVIMSKHDDV